MTTDERDVLDELGALLDVEPSAAFAAHVRHAIERDTPRRLSWRLMAVVGMGVALAGVVFTVAIQRPAPVRARVSRIASAATPPVQEPARSAAPEPREVQDGREMAPKPRVPVAAEEIVDLSPVVTHVDGVDVIVPGDQRLALARLVAGIRGGRVVVAATGLPKYDADGLLLPIAPVVLTTIPDPVTPIDPNDIDGGSKQLPREKR